MAPGGCRFRMNQSIELLSKWWGFADRPANVEARFGPFEMASCPRLRSAVRHCASLQMSE